MQAYVQARAMVYGRINTMSFPQGHLVGVGELRRLGSKKNRGNKDQAGTRCTKAKVS